MTGWRAAVALSVMSLCIAIDVRLLGGPWWLAYVLVTVWGAICPWRIRARPPSTNAVDPRAQPSGTLTPRDETHSSSSYDESPF